MRPPHVQTKREIEAILSRAGIRPRKRFGQHFLIDGNLMRRLHKSADLREDDLAVEVGGGTGGLTDLLVASGCEVVCVEIDRTFAALLERRFADQPRFRLVVGDVLHRKHEVHPDLGEAIRGHAERGAGQAKLVANLPYQVATPLIMNLLVDYPEVRLMCFTVQAEVGDRIIATPGTKAYGPLSIASQLCCVIETVARVGPRSFWPVPKVESLMLRLEVKQDTPIGQPNLAAFVEFVQNTFTHRRKTLRSALGYVLDDARRQRVCSLIDATRRPESIGIDEWVEVFHAASD
ncbi:MAG: ribosomal RNA small subunit methyltransferase A [Phycisphaerales bacterium]|nr:MAG: ribosomal RNA small subunit methyltransferase A [Phycisphaerales bacterium]